MTPDVRAGGDLRPLLSNRETRGNVPTAHILRNIDINCGRGLHEVVKDSHSGVWVIAADGPSLPDSFDDIQSHKNATICAIKGAHDLLVNHGIGFDACVCMDARPTTVLTPQARVSYFLASQCDPGLFDSLKGYGVWLWHCSTPEVDIAPVVLKHYPTATLLRGGSTAALRAMSVGYRLGYREMHLYGCDSSFSEGRTHASGKSTPDDAFTVAHAGRGFLTNWPLAWQARHFMDAALGLEAQGCRVEAHGDGLLPWMWKNKEISC